MEIHNFAQRYATARQRIETSPLSAKNKHLILAFIDDLVLEELSKPRLLKYLSTVSMIALCLGKDLDTVTADDLKQFVAALQQRSDYSPWTKRGYKIALRRFYRWLEKTQNYPKIVDWISTRMNKTEKKLPADGDMLTEKDIEKLMANAIHPRDKAFISVLWESGARIGEIGNLRMKHVCFDQYGTVLSVTGKTGSRKIRLIASTPHLSTWINTHPAKNDKEAHVWVNIGCLNIHKPMTYGAMRRVLQRLFPRAGIHKRYNPHLFRHSRATFMANYLTEFQMNQYFGWVQGSGMPATYVHMSGRDIDSALLAMNGIQTAEKRREELLLPKKCPRCDTINTHEAIHCMKCAGILDLKYAMELEERQKEEKEMRSSADAVMEQLLNDKEVQQFLLQKMAVLKKGVVSEN